MKMKSSTYIVVLLMVFVTYSISAQTKKLQSVIETYESHEAYDREDYPLGLYTEDYYQSEAQFSKSLLGELAKIDTAKLNETDLISYELLKFRLKETVDFYEFKAYLNPLLSDSGFHLSLSYEVRDINTKREALWYLKKLEAIPTYVDQHLALLRKGLEQGISQPRIIFEGYASTYESQIVENPEDSYFFSPFENLPNSIAKPIQDSLVNVARLSIKNHVTPEFKRIKQFFETEYLPKTKTALGVSESPQGKAYYQNRLDYYTTLNLSAKEKSFSS